MTATGTSPPQSQPARWLCARSSIPQLKTAPALWDSRNINSPPRTDLLVVTDVFAPPRERNATSNPRRVRVLAFPTARTGPTGTRLCGRWFSTNLGKKSTSPPPPPPPRWMIEAGRAW